MNVGRRGFLSLACSAAAAGFANAFAEGAKSPSAGRPWRGWTKGRFQVHFIYTGVAESMFWIMPDGTTMLLDCGDHPALTRGRLSVPVLPDPGRLAGEWIARYVRRVNPNGENVDYMMLSHYHSDHGGCCHWQSSAPRGTYPGSPGERLAKGEHWRSGFGLAAEQLRFRKAIDRAWPTYDDPIPTSAGERVHEHMDKIYKWLKERDGMTVEKFRLGATDQLVPVREPAAATGFSVHNICANGRIVGRDGKVRDLYADLIARTRATWLNENAMSLGVVATYGAFKFYSAGDFSDTIRNADGSRTAIEDVLAEVTDPVQVAKVNHHGHYSMPAKLVKALAARVWVGCVWDTLHMVDPVCARLADRSLYPGDRVICPGVFPASRMKEDVGRPWTGALAPASLDAGHVVLDVPPGGETYSVSYLTAADESMTVMSEMSFRS